LLGGALEDLAGTNTSQGPLRLTEVKQGRFPEERDAVVAAGDEEGAVARVKYFGGRASARVRPWIEARLLRDEQLAAELVRALADLLPPGGYLMVGYGDDETERALKRRVPPVASPLGKALYDAGCTWFKDWYYPEGWMEGGMKLQGNKPVSDEARQANEEALRAELEEWLERERSDDEIIRRARGRAVEILGTR
jgi:hypothetical protein